MSDMKLEDNSFSSLFNAQCKRLNIKPLIILEKKTTAKHNFTPLNVIEQLNEKNERLIKSMRGDIQFLTQLRLPGAKAMTPQFKDIIIHIIPRIINLKEVYIGQAKQDINWFEQLCTTLQNSQVQNIEIVSSEISDQDCPALQALLSCSQTLESLKLSDNFISENGIQMICFGIPKNSILKTLHIGGNPIGDNGAQFLMKTLPDSNIQSLGLRNTKISNDGFLSIGQYLVQKECKLLDLQLRKNTLNEDISDNFAHLLQQNNSLRILEFTDCGLTSLAMNNLSKAFRFNHHIHALTFSSNEFGDDAAMSIGQIICNCPQLTTLQLDGCKLTCRAIVAIFQQLSLVPTQLSGISLSKNLISTQGLQILGKAVARGQLSSLNVSYNSLNEVSIQQFCGVLTNSQVCKLKHLDLSSNLLGDSGAEALAGLISQNYTLQRLFLTDCGINENGGKALNAALESNYSILHMQYGGQGKFANQISKQTRLVIDSKLKRNQEAQNTYNSSSQLDSQLLLPPGLEAQSFGSLSAGDLASFGSFNTISQLHIVSDSLLRYPSNQAIVPSLSSFSQINLAQTMNQVGSQQELSSKVFSNPQTPTLKQNVVVSFMQKPASQFKLADQAGPSVVLNDEVADE